MADQPATNTNWDSPVAWGIDVTEETARQVAQADFDVRVPDLKGELLKIQATDPAEVPEDGGADTACSMTSRRVTGSPRWRDC